MKKAFLVIPAVVVGALLWVMLVDKSPETGAPARDESKSVSDTPRSTEASSVRRKQAQTDNSSIADGGEQRQESDRFETPQHVLREVVADKGINQSAAEEALKGDRFHELTAALRSQALTSEESMRNEEFEAFIIDYATSASSDVTYDEMECGKSVCALSFRTHGDDWKRFYNELPPDHETHRAYVIIGRESNQDGIHRLRLLVSIDPDVSSIVVPAPK